MFAFLFTGYPPPHTFGKAAAPSSLVRIDADARHDCVEILLTHWDESQTVLGATSASTRAVRKNREKNRGNVMRV